MFAPSCKLLDLAHNKLTDLPEGIDFAKLIQEKEPSIARQAIAKNIATAYSDKLLLISTKTAYYLDSRSTQIYHPALVYSINSLQEESFSYQGLLNQLLENSSCQLIQSLNSSNSFSQKVTKEIEVILFLNSGNKAKTSSTAYFNPYNTQDQDFEAANLVFASDRNASVACATVVAETRALEIDLKRPFKELRQEELAKLNTSSVSLLSRLMNGAIRSENGTFYIDSSGNLIFSRAFLNAEDHLTWAFAQKLV
jgi:hypothetical protein